MRATLRRLSLAALVLLLSAPPAPAAESPTAAAGAALRVVTEGTLFWRTAPEAALVPAPVLRTDVDIRVTGMIARATVRQEFTNPAAAWAEGVYVFPLPDDAAVDHLRMRVGERVIEGVIRERGEAKAVYERARQEGRRASLVEQERPNIFTTSVANIAPGAVIAVEIEYQHTVRYDAGRFHLRFPMVVGPRYVPAGVADAARLTPPVAHPARGPLNPVALRVELDPGVPLGSLGATSHAVRTSALAAGRILVELDQGEVPADRDFELVWEPAADQAPLAALLAERRGDEVFALLMVVPPALAAPAGAGQPREAIFAIDVSGSMHGQSIEQARGALRLALARLGPADTFNVIAFNHRTTRLFPAAVPATPAHVRQADRWVAALRAQGGTEMLPALLTALDASERPVRLRQVVFLTDGAVGNEAQLFAAIRERLGASRLFTLGIGSAPNSHFMREATRLGRGTFTFIGNTGEVQEAMGALFAKLEAPALTDLVLELPAEAGAEVLPAPLPDLYVGEPVLVALRARTLPVRAVLRGRAGALEWERVLALAPEPAGAGLAVHWARAKIAALLDQPRAGAPEEDVRRAVLEVALAHHLVSRYTSLVAVDVTPVRPGDADLWTHALETNLPHGWDYTAVFGLGQGATPATLHLALGLAALLLAAGLTVLHHSRTALARPPRATPVGE